VPRNRWAEGRNPVGILKWNAKAQGKVESFFASARLGALALKFTRPLFSLPKSSNQFIRCAWQVTKSNHKKFGLSLPG